MAKTYFLHQDLDNWYTNKNLYYLLWFNPTLWTVIFDDEKVNLVFDARYFWKIQKIPKSRFKKVFWNKMEIKNILLNIDLEIKIDKLIKWKELIIEKNLPTCMYKKLKELKPEKIEMISNIFAKERIIKKDCEINKIKKAITIINKVYREIYSKKETLIWKTEREVRKMIIELIITNWWDEESFPTIVAFWKNSAIPHHEAWNTKISNWPLLIDMWAVYQWYLSDFTRTFWVWEKNDDYIEFQKILKIVINAHNLWKNSVKEWLNWKEIDKLVRDYIWSFWYAKYFTHSTWHWIWLQNHEEPWISERKWDKKLEKWMVFTIEPGIYLPNKFWVRWENIIII